MALAADIMTRDLLTVSPETPVGEAAKLLAEHRFSALPVLKDGRLVGVVTEEDMVERAAELHLPRHVQFLGSIIYLENPQRFTEEADKILAMTAGELMHRTWQATEPDTPVADLAAAMLEQGIRRYMVVDLEGRLLGIITRSDIVRMMVQDHRLPGEGKGA